MIPIAGRDTVMSRPAPDTEGPYRSVPPIPRTYKINMNSVIKTLGIAVIMGATVVSATCIFANREDKKACRTRLFKGSDDVECRADQVLDVITYQNQGAAICRCKGEIAASK